MAVTTTSNVTVLSGNRVEIRFQDGTVVGLCQSLRASDDYGPQEVSGIGDIHVKEWVPSLARHTLNVSVVQMKASSLESYGIGALNGTDVLKGLVFDIVVVSKDITAGGQGKALRTYNSCSFASGDVEITKHALIIRNATFMALDVQGDFTNP